MAHIANKIDAKDKKLSEIFSKNRYKIDVFQREYRWQRPQIEALISDLALSFLNSYKEGDGMSDCNMYDCYYMGPIVLCQSENGDLSIVDGQQRLTSFTLLLIYLYHKQLELQVSDDNLLELNDYVYVKKGGKRTLVLNIEKRNTVIERIIQNPHNISNLIAEIGIEDNESNQNLIARYQDIETLFPKEILDRIILPIFTEWILHNIVLVEVRAYSIENAYSIFETMNDRGLSLNPTEILKAFLISKIEDKYPENEDKAEEVNTFWTERIQKMRFETNSEIADLDFFRAWLRGKYAESQRENKIGSENADFENIGTQFHTWVKTNTKKIGLNSYKDFFYFMRSDFDFYSSLYLSLNAYKHNCVVGFEDLYITTSFGIADSLSYPLYMSSISKIDNEDTIRKKIQTVTKFIDKYTNIRVLQDKTISQSSIRNYFYDLVKKIRNIDLDSLQSILDNEEKKLSIDPDFGYMKMNYANYFHYFYARIMYLENDINEFRTLLRSRRQNSYILVPLFSYDDFFEFTRDEYKSTTYSLSVANYCLMKKTDYVEYTKLTTFDEKISFLKERKYINSYYNPETFINYKNNLLKEEILKIWG